MRNTARYARVTWKLSQCQAAASQQLLVALAIASFLSISSAQGEALTCRAPWTKIQTLQLCRP